MIRISLFFILLLVGAVIGSQWLLRQQVPDQDRLETIKLVARELETKKELLTDLTEKGIESNGEVSELIESEKVTDFRQKISKFFVGSDSDLIIMKYLESKEFNFNNQGERLALVAEIAKNVRPSMDSLHEAYKSMPAEEFRNERLDMLELVGLVAETSTENKEHARAFFKEVLSAKVDRIDPKDPLSSVSLRAVSQLLKIETDPEERKKIANDFLQEARTPSVKAELSRILGL